MIGRNVKQYEMCMTIIKRMRYYIPGEGTLNLFVHNYVNVYWLDYHVQLMRVMIVIQNYCQCQLLWKLKRTMNFDCNSVMLNIEHMYKPICNYF